MNKEDTWGNGLNNGSDEIPLWRKKGDLPTFDRNDLLGWACKERCSLRFNKLKLLRR